jgi:hypothetical protein
VRLPLWALPSAAVAALTLTACGSSAPSASKSATSSAESACQNKSPASGDIYVWEESPGVEPMAHQLGGGWVWNHSLNRCQTSVQFMIATAPNGPADCTEIGYVADNPGYNPNADPAHPPKHIADKSGPC